MLPTDRPTPPHPADCPDAAEKAAWEAAGINPDVDRDSEEADYERARIAALGYDDTYFDGPEDDYVNDDDINWGKLEDDAYGHLFRAPI